MSLLTSRAVIIPDLVVCIAGCDDGRYFAVTEQLAAAAALHVHCHV